MKTWQRSVPTLYRWITTLAFVGIVVALSVAPGIEQPDDTIFSWIVANTATPIQKAMHVTVYAVLAALCIWILESVNSRSVRGAVAMVTTVGLGVFLEWYQTSVPGRYGTLLDVLLNFAGSLLGLIAALWLISAKFTSPGSPAPPPSSP